MWFIFKGSAFKHVDSESVIKDNCQVICDDEVEYLYNDIQDYKDLMRQDLPPEHKWGEVEVQDMKGITLEELDIVEKLFDLHIDGFALRDATTQDKKGDQLKNMCHSG